MSALSNRIMVTGGAGFIGANFVLRWLEERGTPIVNLDKLTYAGNLETLRDLRDDDRHIFIQGDIADRELVRHGLEEHCPWAIVHFAAESHVDRSILGPAEFVRTNVQGTFELLEEMRRYWSGLGPIDRRQFRFLHVSTDEVYGSLGPNDPAFSETTSYAPNSPYSASKAASDHFVRAYHQTYGLPTLTTNCSNNYGPRQFPEKLIPLMVLNALKGKPLPVYGDGLNVRDWLYVADHCDAIAAVLERGRVGETYNIGGREEKTNLDVVRTICAVLQELRPCAVGSYDSLVTFVPDRPGHDRRYAMNTAKIECDLAWTPAENFTTGVRKTVQWYLENMGWVESVTRGAYRHWIKRQYASI